MESSVLNSFWGDFCQVISDQRYKCVFVVCVSEEWDVVVKVLFILISLAGEILVLSDQFMPQGLTPVDFFRWLVLENHKVERGPSWIFYLWYANCYTGSNPPYSQTHKMSKSYPHQPVLACLYLLWLYCPGFRREEGGYRGISKQLFSEFWSGQVIHCCF